MVPHAMAQKNLRGHICRSARYMLCYPGLSSYVSAVMVQESLGGYGEEGSFPATASTAAAQQALTQSRQRRDERALDKGTHAFALSGPALIIRVTPMGKSFSPGNLHMLSCLHAVEVPNTRLPRATHKARQDDEPS